MIDQAIRDLELLKSLNIEELTRITIEENSDILLTLLKMQLQEGLTASGIMSTSRRGGQKYDYSKFTIKNKLINGNGIGKEVSFITNYMTGEMQSSLKIKIFDNQFEFYSNDPVFEIRKLKSPEDAFELSDENCRYFGEMILFPELKLKVELYLQTML